VDCTIKEIKPKKKMKKEKGKRKRDSMRSDKTIIRYQHKAAFRMCQDCSPRLPRMSVNKLETLSALKSIEIYIEMPNSAGRKS
jgi:hypothetical protein